MKNNFELERVRTGGTVRHIAVSQTATDVFATAEFSRKVSLWSVRDQKRFAQINTVLDYGGRRLAVVQKSDSCLCIAASFEGPANAYDLKGNILWSRKDLTSIQQIVPMYSSVEPTVGVGMEGQPFKILNVFDGKEIAQLNGVREIYTSNIGKALLTVSGKRVLCLESWDSPPRWERPMQSFGLLVAAFSPLEVVYSEAAGATYCFDLGGEPRWVLQPQKGHHFVRVSWNCMAGIWIVVDWNYEEGGPKRLFKVDTAGNQEFITIIGTPAETEFLNNGDLLITSDGKILESLSGEVVWRYL